MSHHIECRTPETDSGTVDATGRTIRIPAGPWVRDEAAMGPVALYTWPRSALPASGASTPSGNGARSPTDRSLAHTLGRLPPRSRLEPSEAHRKDPAMRTLVAHYRRTVIDSLRIASHPSTGSPSAYRSVARTNLALLVDARGRGQGRAPTDADALEMYRAAVARMVRPAAKPPGCGHCGLPEDTCSDCAY